MTKLFTKSGAELSLGRLVVNLPFMLRNLHTLVRQETEAIRSDLSLPAHSVGIMIVVSENPGISQNDLATVMVLNKTAVANCVKPLEAAGLLTRRRQADGDGRYNALFLTDTGRLLLKQSEKLLNNFDRRAFANVSKADQVTFFKVCGQLVANLDDRVSHLAVE